MTFIIIGLPTSCSISCDEYFKWFAEIRTNYFKEGLISIGMQYNLTRPKCQKFRVLVFQSLCASCANLVTAWYRGESLFLCLSVCLFEGLLNLICRSKGA